MVTEREEAGVGPGEAPPPRLRFLEEDIVRICTRKRQSSTPRIGESESIDAQGRVATDREPLLVSTTTGLFFAFFAAPVSSGRPSRFWPSDGSAARSLPFYEQCSANYVLRELRRLARAACYKTAKQTCQTQLACFLAISTKRVATQSGLAEPSRRHVEAPPRPKAEGVPLHAEARRSEARLSRNSFSCNRKKTG